ncbi:hypothetical protein M8J77_021281 [Diaphorina citri]|nr:hypothetical protein M8J77_021281 [Diaphorina citri]
MDTLSKTDDLDGIVQTVRDLEDSRDEYACENESLQQTIAELEKQVEKLEIENRSGKAKIEDQALTIQTLMRELKHLQVSVQTKDMEIIQLKSQSREFEDVKQENERMAADVISCESQNFKLKEVVNKLETTVAQKTAIITRGDGHMKQLHGKVTDLRKKNECLMEERAVALKQLENCQKNLEESVSERDQMNEKLAQCVAAREKLEDLVKKQQAETKTLKSELAKEVADNAKLQNKLTSMEEEQVKLKREIQDLNQEIDNLQDELYDCQGILDKTNAELKKRNEEFNNYRNSVSSIKEKILSARTMTPICPIGSRQGKTICPIGSRQGKTICPIGSRQGKIHKSRRRRPHVLKAQVSSLVNLYTNRNPCTTSTLYNQSSNSSCATQKQGSLSCATQKQGSLHVNFFNDKC